MDTRSISRRITHPRHAPNRIEMVVAGNIVGSFVCQTNVGNKSCSRVTTREREGEGKGGELLPSKLPFEYHRKYRTSFSQVSFRGQKSSRIRHGDDLYFQVAPTWNNSIYIYIYAIERRYFFFHESNSPNSR